MSGTRTSRASAARAADTADSVTVSRRAASRTLPASATIASARSRATVDIVVAFSDASLTDCLSVALPARRQGHATARTGLARSRSGRGTLDKLTAQHELDGRAG